MGVTLTYQAIPSQSNFYLRLQNDRAFRVIANSLSCSGNLFNLFENNPKEFNEYMREAISSDRDILCRTKLEKSMLMGDFREAVRIICRDYPNIVRADASLDKSFEEISDKLNPTQNENWSFGAYQDILILEGRIVMQKTRC